MSPVDSRPIDEHEKENSFSVYVTFSIGELWMLHDVIRHELSGMKEWKFPPANKVLNDEIALALNSCFENKIAEYSLLLSVGDLLVIDYNVRRDMKTPEGAKGEDILKKVFKARAELAFGGLLGKEKDRTYLEVKKENEENAISEEEEQPPEEVMTE